MVWVLGLVFTVWFQLACANNQNNAKYPSKDGDAEVQVNPQCNGGFHLNVAKKHSATEPHLHCNITNAKSCLQYCIVTTVS